MTTGAGWKRVRGKIEIPNVRNPVQDIRQAAAWILFALVFLSPLPFGAVQGWATGVLEVVLFALFIVVLIRGLLTGESLRLPLLAAAAMFFMLHLIQILPLPERLLEPLSPFSHYIFQALRPDDSGQLWQTVSVSPEATISSLFWFSACLATFHIARMISRRGGKPGNDAPAHRNRAATPFGIPTRNRPEAAALFLSFTLVAAGTFQAVYGLAEHFFGWNRIFFYVRRFPMEGVAGTFINTNNCAAFLALCLPLTLSLVLYLQHFKERKPDRQGLRKKKKAAAPLRFPVRILLLSGAAALIALALVFTRSGGGIISSSAGLVLFFLYYFFRRPGGKPLLPGLSVLAVALLALAAIGLFLGPDFTMNSLVTESTGHAAGRFTVWTESMAISNDYPLFGSGAGTYGQLMLHYCNRMVVHAHNEYVELFCEHGPAGLLALLLFIWYFVRLLFAVHSGTLRNRSRSGAFPSSFILPLGLSVSLLGLMIHCIVDFPLRIPAIALAGSCLLGVLSAMVVQRSARRAARRRTGHVLLIITAAVLLCLSGLRLFTAAGYGAGFERRVATVRGEIDRLSADGPATAASGPESATALAVRSLLLDRPLDLRGHRLAFELARLQGKSLDMERALVRGVLARPSLSQMSYDLGQFLLGRGRFREGLSWFRRSLELDVKYLDEIYETCARIFARRFERFEFIFPREPAVRERLGELLHISGLAPQSLEQYQWCLSRLPDRAQLHARVANIHRENGDYDEALAAIDEALRLDPAGREQYFLTRATTLLQMGNVSGAIDACRALLSANPGYEEGYVLLADCFIEQGEAWNAISTYREALWRIPRRSRIHRLLGDLYAAKGKQHQALEEYQAGVREASTDYERKLVLYRMGLCYEEQGRLEEALEALARAAELPVEGRKNLDQRVAKAVARIEGKLGTS